MIAAPTETKCSFVAHDLWDALSGDVLAKVNARHVTLDPEQIGFLFGDGLNEFIIKVTPNGIETHAMAVGDDLKAKRVFERTIQTPMGVNHAIEDAFKIVRQ